MSSIKHTFQVHGVGGVKAYRHFELAMVGAGSTIPAFATTASMLL